MNDRASGLVLSVSILVSVAVGVVIGGLFAHGSTTPAVSTSLSLGEAKELTDAIHALRLEMEHAREPKVELSAPPPIPAPSRVDASPDASVALTDVAKELREATAEFVRAVGEMRNSITPEGPEAPAPVFPNVQPDRALIDDAAALSAEMRNKAFLFWTYQQVATRFGAPTSSRRDKSGSVQWWYASKNPDEGIGLTFSFANGTVFAIE